MLPMLLQIGGRWRCMTCWMCSFIWWLRPHDKNNCIYIIYTYTYVLIYTIYIYVYIQICIYIHVYTHVKIHQHQPQRSTLSTSSVLGHLSFITSTHFQPNQVGDMQSYARWLMGVACQVVPLKIFFWKVRSTGSQMKACLFVSRISIYQVKR